MKSGFVVGFWNPGVQTPLMRLVVRFFVVVGFVGHPSFGNDNDNERKAVSVYCRSPHPMAILAESFLPASPYLLAPDGRLDKSGG